ncbi:MAG: hypothetical protein P8R42_04710 [Candidatus Binatia bacterium]|nr:hypothetical protein [Candidatus Binatia bacterium]
MLWRTGLAALLFLATSLFLLREVLPAPDSLLQTFETAETDGATRWSRIATADQAMVVALVANNADSLASDPASLARGGQCFPLKNSFTLGEHGFAEGILASIPWLATGDPVLTYNVLLLLGYFLAGFSMFLLATHFTGDPRAGVLAGLLLQLVPGRITDAGHPYLYAEFWLAFALLFLHRLFALGDLRAAVGVAFFLGILALESIYLILGTIPVVLLYVGFLFWRHREHRWKALLSCAGAGIWVVGVALLVFLPYLETRDTWAALDGRVALLPLITVFGPGQPFFPGWIFVGLLAIAILDRFRGPRRRHGEDPRWVMAGSAVLILWFGTNRMSIPGTGIYVSGLFPLAKGFIPGLDAIRAPGYLLNIVWVPLALLAAYGALALFSAMSSRLGWGVFVGLALGILGIRFVPSVAVLNFGHDVQMTARDVRPSPEDISLIRELPPGAVLHLPMPVSGPAIPSTVQAEQLLLGSFSPRATTTCYNSFETPYAGQIGQLAAALPRAAGVVALESIGVESIVFHRNRSLKYERWFRNKAATMDQAQPRLVLVGETESLLAYQLESSLEHDASPAVLGASVGPVRVWVEDEAAPIAFAVENRGEQVYRSEGPLGYENGVVQWLNPSGELIASEEVRFLLPLALAPAGQMSLAIDLEPPAAPGRFDGYLYRVSDPGRPIGLARIRRR